LPTACLHTKLYATDIDLLLLLFQIRKLAVGNKDDHAMCNVPSRA